ncbi:MAG: UDP-glucose 4-epimerase GalE [Chloroflexota bacterium]
MKILVTGGAGYIGSHTVVELLTAGHEVVVVDNLCNSKEEALRRVEELTGKRVSFYKVDLLDEAGLDSILGEHNVGAVIHFAGLKAVGESVEKPLLYYENNLAGTAVLCKVMARHGVKNIVFSSSCTVYGEPERMPITEDFPTMAYSPYGRTKWMIEMMLQDLYDSDNEWNIILLRYFNPVGAHKSGRIGEDPNGIPNNLVPYITQVAVGKLPHLRVFGADYPTRDGTCIRDYIHVVDLAHGHLKALDKLADNPGAVAYNLGTGTGSTVLEVIQAFERATGQKIAYQLAARRPGDVTAAYADPQKAAAELGWQAERSLDEMCADAWRWQSQNPNGYEK